MSRTDLVKILASANAATVRNLAAEIVRLKAHSSTLQAELRSSASDFFTPNGLAEARAANGESDKLQQSLANLAQAQAAMATLSENNHALRRQCAALGEGVAKLEDHNRLLTKTAIDMTRQGQETEARLTQTNIELTVIRSDNERLLAEHAALSQRADSLENHNRLLTQSAIDTALRLQDCEAKLAGALTEVANLARDNEYVRVEHALQAQRAAEFDEHNRVLTETLAEKTRQFEEQISNKARSTGLEERNRELTLRITEFEDTIRLLTESLTDRVREVQEQQAKLTEAQVEIATLAPENLRLHSEHVVMSRRANELEDHNRLLTESAIDTTLKLQESEGKLAQALTKIENARPMELGYNPHPRFTRWVIERKVLSSPFRLIDVGVQGGIHPRWNSLGEALHVQAFDPLMEAIEPLAAHQRANHVYHAFALADENGQRDFYVPRARPAASFHPREPAQDQARMSISAANWEETETRRVTTRRLDSLMDEGLVAHADFLKLDCEGFEPAVLRGAPRFLAEAGLLGIDSEIGFSSIHWPQTHFLAVYEQLVPHEFRMFDIAFNRVPFRHYFERAREFGREAEAAASVSLPGSFNVLFSHAIAGIKRRPTPDEVLKRAIIFELYGMLDVAYDLLQYFSAVMPAGFPLQEGADLLIPE